MGSNYCYFWLIFTAWLWSTSGQVNETLRACQSVIACFNDAQNEMDRCLAILIGEKPPQIAAPGQPPLVTEAPPRPKAADPDDCMRDVKDKIKQRRLLDKAKLQDFQGCLSSKIESGTEDVDPRKYRYCATVTGRYVNKTTEISRRQKRQAVKASSAQPPIDDKTGPSSTAKPALAPALSTQSPPAPDTAGLSSVSDAGTTFVLIDAGVTPRSGSPGVDSLPSTSNASTSAPVVLDTAAKDNENGSQPETASDTASTPKAATPGADGNPSTEAPATSKKVEAGAEKAARSSAPTATLSPQKEKTAAPAGEQAANESAPAQTNEPATVARQAASDTSATESPVAQESTFSSKSGTSTTEHPSTPRASSTQKAPAPPAPITPQPQPVGGLRIEAPGVVSRPGGAPVAASFPNSNTGVSGDKPKNAAVTAEPIAPTTAPSAAIQENIENPPSQISLETQQRNRAEILREARRRLSEFKGCMARARIKREECKPLVRCCPDAATCYLGYELSDLHNKVHKLERDLLQGRQDCVHKKRALNRDELADALDQIDAEELISDDSVVSQVIF